MSDISRLNSASCSGESISSLATGPESAKKSLYSWLKVGAHIPSPKPAPYSVLKVRILQLLKHISPNRPPQAAPTAARLPTEYRKGENSLPAASPRFSDFLACSSASRTSDSYAGPVAWAGLLFSWACAADLSPSPAII